jgi:uncharacterized protein (DUF1330 family)
MGELLRYIEPTRESAKAFSARDLQGSVVMLNLLRFREIADYSSTPHLAPSTQISGKQAYQLYMEHTRPHLQKSGGELIFLGRGGQLLIGPPDERWDAVLLVRHRSTKDFISFASNPEYLAGIGHRIAALEDSRLLPLSEQQTL